ncbi:NUDIX domain-containing protein [Antrihabitans stalactiti]|uniref:NUDIX domain-containing protein n=1 Tax=Antrihabitans stalactiti TaxID=2584121 RepID=A0A848KEA3_9NOCA|nr:NUDIX domain-containing protein [Antrihabitans stalactiti]
MSAESLTTSTIDVLESWRPAATSDEVLRHTLLAFVGSAPRGCLRENVPGHITASSLVMNEGRTHVLLTLHPRVGRWIQLGGHCEESDATIVDAALREAREESGIDELRIDPTLLSAHTHPITCSLGVPTRHLDLRFLVYARDDAQIAISSESDDLRWWPIDGLPENAERDTISELVRLALAR